MTRLLAILVAALALTAYAVPFSFWQNPAAPASVTDNTWAFWKLTEGAGTNRADTGGGAATVIELIDTVPNAADFGIPNCAVFNAGTHYLGTETNLVASNAFMIWGNVQVAIGAVGNQDILSHGNWLGSAPDAWTVFVADATGFYFRMRDSVGDNFDVSTGFIYGAGQSVFFAAGYDGTQSVLYTNGVLASSNTFTRGASFAGPLLFGNETNFNGPLAGKLDAVGFTNGAPTQAQVDYWYNGGAGREFP